MFKKKLSAGVLSLAILFTASSFTVSATEELPEATPAKVEEVETVLSADESEAELFEEAAHIAAYREAGYSILYVKNSATGDGSTIESPLPGGTLPDLVKNYVKAEYDTNNNKKILFAIVGKLACGWYGNQSAETGYDIVITSATGTSEDYIYPSGGSTPAARPVMLTGAGNVFTFDNITLKVPHSEAHINTFTAGNAILKNVTVIKESDGNKSFVSFGNNDTTTYAGGKIEIYNSNIDILRGSSYINADTEYVIGADATVGEFIPMNNGAKITGDVIVTISGGTVTKLYTTPANASGIITGDYVTYLNSGSIGTVVKSATPGDGKGVQGKTILIVNDNTADIPESISEMPYIVSYTGDGDVSYDTSTDMLVLEPTGDNNKVTVNGTDFFENQSIELTAGTTTVEFSYEEIIETAQVTFDANGGAWGEESTKTVEINVGDTPEAPETAPTRDGYTFMGWTPVFSEATAEGATYKAIWESNHINAYREKGYSVLYIKNSATGDGSSVESPLPGGTLPDLVKNYIKAEYDTNNNQKILFAYIGKLNCGWYGNQSAETGYDIVVTSATGTSDDYIYLSGGSNPAARPVMLTGAGNIFTFDNITFKIPHSEGQLNAFTAGNAILKDVTVIKESETNKFIVSFGNNDTTTYAGGTIEINNSDIDILRGSSYINANTEYIIGASSNVGQFIPMNNGAKITGNAIVTINGGTVTTLYTTPANASGVITGDYVTYLNRGTIGTVVKSASPGEGKGVQGKTILIVNNNYADIPESISDMPYIVSYTGNGTATYDTATDKLVLTPGAEIKYVRITNGTDVKEYNANGDEVVLMSEFEVELSEGTTTVEFIEDATEGYTVTWINGEDVTTELVAKGTVPTAPSFIKTGYTLGWDKEIVAVAGDVTYTATWTAKEYDVVFDAGEGVFKDGEKTITVKATFDAAITAPEEEPTLEGYVFKGWTPEVGILTTEGTTFTATYELDIPEEVTVSIKVVFARAGAPMTGNYAKLYIYKDSTKTELAGTYSIEDKNTVSSEVSVEIELTEGTYYAEIVKNGYLTYKTELIIAEDMAEIDEIKLIPGDIKGSYADECGDGVIDIDDFVRILRGFVSDANEALSTAVDINEDGLVNVSDIGFIKANFGKTSDAE